LIINHHINHHIWMARGCAIGLGAATQMLTLMERDLFTVGQ
jgi:hypothetical protein